MDAIPHIHFVYSTCLSPLTSVNDDSYCKAKREKFAINKTESTCLYEQILTKKKENNKSKPNNICELDQNVLYDN